MITMQNTPIFLARHVARRMVKIDVDYGPEKQREGERFNLEVILNGFVWALLFRFERYFWTVIVDIQGSWAFYVERPSALLSMLNKHISQILKKISIFIQYSIMSKAFSVE